MNNNWNNNNWNDNDWNQPASGGEPQNQWSQPQPGNPQHGWQQHHHQPHNPYGPPVDPSGYAPTEATLDSVIDNFKLLLGRTRGPMLYGWLIAGALDFVFVVIAVVLGLVLLGGLGAGGKTGNMVALGAGAAGLMSIVALILVNAMRTAFYRPMRMILVHGSHTVPDVKAFLKIALERAVPVFFVTILGTLIVIGGMLMCIIPGLVAAFLLMPANYIAATRDDLSTTECLREAYEMARANVGLLFVGIGALIGVGMVVGGGSVVFGSIASAVFGAYGEVVVQFIEWGLQVVVGFFGWLAVGSMFITIDCAESGESIAVE